MCCKVVSTKTWNEINCTRAKFEMPDAERTSLNSNKYRFSGNILNFLSFKKPTMDSITFLFLDSLGCFVVLENRNKVIYVEIPCTIYSMLESILVWYWEFQSDIEELGFVLNPYDACVANHMVDRQHTIHFHVDDLLISHLNPKPNDQFVKQLNTKYRK